MQREQKKRFIIQSLVFAALIIVLAIILPDSKSSNAMFTILIAAYAATIASTGGSKCFRRSRPDSDETTELPRGGA